MYSENFIKYQQLRKLHPEFIYESYNLSFDKQQLCIEFTFVLDKKAIFKPSLKFPFSKHFSKENMSLEKLKSFAFHIGMVEMISYWKASCSPKIIIKPHNLDQWQLNWWRKLYYLGLGEFFYRNGIELDKDSFVEFECHADTAPAKTDLISGAGVIVPVGGGKDSVLSLEILKDHKKIIPFAMNPGLAIWNSIFNAGFNKEDSVEVKRTIDPKLLQLNEEGYLNGHTPFSALLAFVSLFTAAMTGSGEIALSNESSANESTVKETDVNHQYSKSYEFENDFREYVNRYLTEQIRYFSFLRPWNELQIVKSFSEFVDHHQSFRSCNVGSKTDIWCGECPKCLFTFIMLSAFLKPKQVIDIFYKNLFEESELIPVLDELTGRTPEKPFECVGTIDEVNLALASCIRSNESLPALLNYYRETDQYQKYKDLPLESMLKEFNQEHNLSEEYLNLLLNTI